MPAFLYFTSDPSAMVQTSDTLGHAAQAIAQEIVDPNATPGQYTQRIWVVPADNMKTVDCTVTVNRNVQVSTQIVP